MTKRKSLEEKAFNKQKSRKRVAFSAPKNAATKALIQQNGLTTPLLRLPLEIRNKIWCEVLGDRLVHFRYYYDDDLSFEENEDLHAHRNWSQELRKGYGSAWRHVVCKGDCPEAQEDRKYTTSEGEVFDMQSHYACESGLDYEIPEPDKVYEGWWNCFHETMHLSVLRSCRQIYVEANNILWTSNTFSFADPTTFRRFMMTRNINQRRLIKSLRLQMEGIMNEEYRWNLNMGLIRSLSALRRLRLNIEHKLPTGSYKSAESYTLFYITLNEGLNKLSTLPLTEVEILVQCPRYESQDHLWTKMDRQDFAEALRKVFLNPKGAQIYAEGKLKWKEQCRREREYEAKVKAFMFRPRSHAESESVVNSPLTRPSE